MRTILGRLAEDADLVVVDSPPVQAVTDAVLLSSIVDGTLYVIDAGRTRREAVRRGRQALAYAGTRVLGVTLNRMAQRSGGGYYYYDYGVSKAAVEDQPGVARGVSFAEKPDGS
jgi:Mrp family chromosome partitioning ATPase